MKDILFCVIVAVLYCLIRVAVKKRRERKAQELQDARDELNRLLSERQERQQSIEEAERNLEETRRRLEETEKTQKSMEESLAILDRITNILGNYDSENGTSLLQEFDTYISSRLSPDDLHPEEVQKVFEDFKREVGFDQ